jgi:hypothetical protein
MINFPATTGQPTDGSFTHSEVGLTWTWNGTTWDVEGGPGYVLKAGDTMTGNLTVPSLNGGQLAGARNVLLNGNLAVNQRSITIAAAAVGAYGPDRWKKVDASNMTQVVESGNFIPGAAYTLSGVGVTTQQITAPASGNWTIPSIPITATNVQLEPGAVATPYERRGYSTELLECQRYFVGQRVDVQVPVPGQAIVRFNFPVSMRSAPTMTLREAGTSTGIAVAVDVGGITTEGFYIQVEALAANAFVVGRYNEANAEL